MGWYDIVTSPIMWIVGVILAGNSLVQTVLFLRVSRRTAQEIGLSKEFVAKTLRTGVVSSLGPSMGSFVGMVALVIAMGGAVAWIREAAGIGSIGYELMMAKSGADAAGVTMTRQGMTLIGVSTIVWGMGLTCSPWILTGGVGARFLPRLRDSALGRQPGLMAMVSAAAMLGMFAKFIVDYLIKPAQVAKATAGWANPAALIVGGIAGYIWLTLADKLHKPAMKQFLIIIGIVFGMTAGQIVASIK